MSASKTRQLDVVGPLDLVGTLAPLGASFGDPTMRVRRGRGTFGVGARVSMAARTPDGAAAIEVANNAPGTVVAEAFGAGADWLLDRLPDLVGAADDPHVWTPPSSLRAMAKRAAGARFPRTHRPMEALVVVVLQQKVTGKEAARALRNLVHNFSEPAPGPLALWLPLAPKTLRELPEAAFPPLGVPYRQGALLREIGWRAKRIDAMVDLPPAEAKALLQKLPGIGPWTAESLAFRALGDPDAVPVGDYHLPNIVAYNLAGEERADDARMLDLLAPFRGQRGRVVRWIHEVGASPPRRGPRAPLRPLPTAGGFG